MQIWNNLKSLALVAVLVAAGALTAANAQTTFDDVKQEAQILMETIGDYSHDRRVALVETTRETLQSIDADIAELNARIRDDWNEMSDTVKEDTQAAMDNLHQRRLEVAERLGALEQSSSASWSDLKAGFSAAFAELGTAWENARREFGQD